jgi:hypothetical protein
MGIVFKFRCGQCAREVISDGVVAKCCDQLMEQKESYYLTELEMASLMKGIGRVDEFLEGKG